MIISSLWTYPLTYSDVCYPLYKKHHQIQTLYNSPRETNNEWIKDMDGKIDKF